MATTPEGSVKAKIKTLLVKFGTWFFMPVSSGFGVHGIPDFICCYKGKFFSVEAKAPGKKPTALQCRQMLLIKSAGGVAFVVDGAESLKELELWLECQ